MTVVKPKKSLGQNWLVNPHILDRIIEAAEIKPEDTIVEVGPGTGNLTKKLAGIFEQGSEQKAGRVIAIEKDHRLIQELRQKFQNSNVEIIESDVLEFNPRNYELQAISYKIVANLPYYITSNFLRTVFENWPKPKLIVLTIQKEVAKRIMTPSISSGRTKPLHTNLLALSVRYYSDPKIISYISKNNFYPVPKVDSAIIKLSPKSETPNSEDTKKVFRLIHAGFSEKRKLLVSNISKNTGIDKEKILEALFREGIDPKARAENLSLKEWQNLSKIL